MKVYKVTVMVVDHDNLGPRGITDEMEAVRYPNHCLFPSVMDIESRDIGDDWQSHPINKTTEKAQAFETLFGRR